MSHGSPVVVFIAARGLLEFQFHCPTNDKIQSHEPSVRSQRAKVARNGKSRGQGKSFFSEKSRYFHLLSILTISDGKM